MSQLTALAQRFEHHVPGLLGARHSYAVLCPLVERPDGLHLLFEVRAETLRRQPGEVCFPGGRMEPGESVADCALRETEEELGIPAGEISLLGRPDFICNQTGFLLQPVLGLVSAQGFARLTPSPAEVAETFTVPLDFFARTPPEEFRYDLLPAVPDSFPYAAVGIPADYSWNRGRVDVPVWQYEGHTIWGMTARIAGDLARTGAGTD
ncbi:MAG: CoA pyrophosphatase [Oscillibacter sp.]